MFFKKKPSNDNAIRLGMLYVQMGTELYKGIGSPDGSSSVTATLAFDSQQRVSEIKNPLVDGLPKIPPFETVEAINNLAAPLSSLAENQKLTNLNIEIVNGQVKTRPEYLNN